MSEVKTISEKSSKAGSFIGGFLLGLVLSAAGALLLFVNVLPQEPVIFVILCILAVGIGIGLGFLFMKISHPTVYQISSEGIRITRGKKEFKYPLSSFRGTSVIKNYYNGIYTGSTRTIKFEQDNGKEKSFTVNMNADNFSALAAAIDRAIYGGVAGAGDEDTDSASEFFDEARIFEIPAEELKKNTCRAVNGTVIGGIILIAVAFAALFMAVADSSYIYIAITASMLFGIAGIIMIIRGIIDSKKNSNRIPSRITLDNHALRADDKVYYIEKIESVIMTPASYKSTSGNNSRIMKITSDGNTDTFFLGRIAPKKNKLVVYPEYEKLFKTVHYWAIAKKVFFKQDLG